MCKRHFVDLWKFNCKFRSEAIELQKHVLSVILVILFADKDTSCSVSASEAVQEHDVIVMTCTITYSGNWAPAMRWFNSVTHHNFNDENVTLTTSNTTVTSQLTIAASADLHGSQVVCLTYFAEPPARLSTSATNIPSYRDTWTSPTLNVQCKCLISIIFTMLSLSYHPVLIAWWLL